MTRRSLTPLLVVSTFSLSFAMAALPLVAQEEAVKKPVKIAADTFSGLKARSIGPALTSGRVGDFAVNPDDPKHYFVAVSGKKECLLGQCGEAIVIVGLKPRL